MEELKLDKRMLNSYYEDAERFVVDYDKDNVDLEISEGSIAFSLRKDRSMKTVVTGIPEFDMSEESEELKTGVEKEKKESKTADGGWRRV